MGARHQHPHLLSRASGAARLANPASKVRVSAGQCGGDGLFIAEEQPKNDDELHSIEEEKDFFYFFIFLKSVQSLEQVIVCLPQRAAAIPAPGSGSGGGGGGGERLMVRAEDDGRGGACVHSSVSKGDRKKQQGGKPV